MCIEMSVWLCCMLNPALSLLLSLSPYHSPLTAKKEKKHHKSASSESESDSDSSSDSSSDSDDSEKESKKKKKKKHKKEAKKKKKEQKRKRKEKKGLVPVTFFALNICSYRPSHVLDCSISNGI